MFEKLDADLNGDPVLVAGPASAEALAAIAAFAGFPLPASYSEFVARYGAAIVGPYPIYGSGVSEAMAAEEASVIGVTQRFRSDRWPGTSEALVISMDHAGNAITLDASGRVQRFDHDDGVEEIISQSFEGFLDWCLSSSRSPS